MAHNYWHVPFRALPLGGTLLLVLVIAIKVLSNRRRKRDKPDDHGAVQGASDSLPNSLPERVSGTNSEIITVAKDS